MQDLVLYGWPYLALVMAVPLAWAAARGRAEGTRWGADPGFVLGLVGPMYLLHQFEEHGIDVFGRRFSFRAALCEVLGQSPAGCIVTPELIFAVNPLACWIAFSLAFFFRRRRPLVAACVWGIPIVNAVAHLGEGAVTGSYNPGVLTSAALFVPVSIWMFRVCFDAGILRRGDVVGIVLVGVVTHVVLLGSLQLRIHGLLSEPMLLVVNVANGLWAWPVGRWLERRRA